MNKRNGFHDQMNVKITKKIKMSDNGIEEINEPDEFIQLPNDKILQTLNENENEKEEEGEEEEIIIQEKKKKQREIEEEIEDDDGEGEDEDDIEEEENAEIEDEIIQFEQRKEGSNEMVNIKCENLEGYLQEIEGYFEFIS